MPKEGKPDKKGPKQSIDWSLYPEDVKEIPNPNFCFGYDAFRLQNSDIYVGEFCAHKMGIAWREGNGVYFTKDGHKYEGKWENDQLLNSEDTEITFPDQTEFRGSVENNKYNGNGIYTLPNKLPIACNLKDNTPYGEIILTDPQGHLWKGIAGAESAILRPENHFYLSIPYDRGVGRMIPKSDYEIKNAESLKSQTSCIEELKELIFRKSTKTLNDFTEYSEDLSEYEEPDTEKLNCERNLKPKSSLLKARSASHVSLLKTFLSKEYRNSCPPVSVIYPTVDMERSEELMREKSEELMEEG